jgi:hypothetical protein
MRVAFSVAGLLMLVPWSASATFHVSVIQEVFLGFAEAPGAQYVILRPQTNLQTLVHGQAFMVSDEAGTALPPFAQFCPSIMQSKCDLPLVSPACAGGGCPSFLEGNDSRVLVETPWARDLFCVAPDLLASGSLPYPDGQVCFGTVGPVFRSGCLALGPVDCLAYGEFTGDNGVFGSPAGAPALGEALVGSLERPSQCNGQLLAADAVCVGGQQANTSCGPQAPCVTGVCSDCPAGGCSALLDDSLGFTSGAPMPQNFHGDVGHVDGVRGDANANGLDVGDVAAVAATLFDAGHRCDLTADQRGADANLDTRLSAADVTATVALVTLTG